jgi:hypothetical protein
MLLFRYRQDHGNLQLPPYKSLANETNRTRQTVVADYYIRFYSLGGALHVHWQSERHQRGSRQLNPHNLPAVHLSK